MNPVGVIQFFRFLRELPRGKELCMNIVVIGAQWGDEGKGKIVDYLAENADCVVRYSGGPNAGHTIVAGGHEFALHQVPSGILHKGKPVFLGGGMVIDAEALFGELEMLESAGVEWENRVFISDRAHLILPRYRRLDKETDLARKRPLGTTGRGIGIAYAQKSSRDGLRLADLDWKEKMLEFEGEDAWFLDKFKSRLLAMRSDLTVKMRDFAGKNVLFEGAQGAMLDIDSGTYPYVSSGASCAAGAALGCGIGPRNIDKVLGVFKAYQTRVGNGPMPTEFNADSEGALCRFVRETGREYGVTTGRARRCGYLDLVALRYACAVNSIDGLVLTHLDIYDSLDCVEACVAYRIGETETCDFPASVEALQRAVPVLKKFDGWKEPIQDRTAFETLPDNARKYIQYIEEYCKTPVTIVSVGCDRNQTITRRNPWEK